MLRALALVTCLIAVSALAQDLTLGIGQTLQLPETSRITLRDPALLEVRTNGTVLAVYGKAAGVTGISVRRTNGNIERILVTITASPAIKADKPEPTSARPVPPKKCSAPEESAAAEAIERAVAEVHSALTASY